MKRDLCITLPFARFLRQIQISFLEILNVFLRLKFSPSLNLSKIEHSSKVSKHSRQRGFLVLEILIAGLILTASIAAAMYLFRMGYDYLEKANRSNLLSSKLVQAAGLLKTVEMEKKSGVEDLGDDVSLKWGAQLLGSSRPVRGGGEFAVTSIHELFLYRVYFSLIYQNTGRDYQINVFRYKPLYSPGTAAP